MRRIAPMRPCPRLIEAQASRPRATPFQCRLVILAKVAAAGRVKTRLAREIGVGEAIRFYRAASGAVMRRLGTQPFWQTVVSVSPDTGVWSPALPAFLARIPQGSGDIGQRMQRPMRILPPGPVCIVGTDVPGIEPAHVRRAFRLLGRADAVFGPAEDGGFWLVGLRRRPRLLFPYRNVRWSAPDTLALTLANLQGIEVALAGRLSDVDCAADLGRFRGMAGRLVRPLPDRLEASPGDSRARSG